MWKLAGNYDLIAELSDAGYGPNAISGSGARKMDKDDRAVAALASTEPHKMVGGSFLWGLVP